MTSGPRPDLGWRGAYINNDDASDRRVALEGALGVTSLDRSYSPVVPDASLEPAALRAHAKALAVGSDEQWLHVVGDAALLSRSLRPVMERLIANGALEDYDLVFTDVTLTLPHIVTLKNLKRAFDRAVAEPSNVDIAIMDLSEESFGGGNSYFVNPRSWASVRSALAAGAAEDTGTPADFFGRAVREGRLRAACTFPYLSCVRLDPGDRDIGPNLLRTIFFWDWNPAVLDAALAALPPAKADPRVDTLADIVGVMVAD
jgi:hypothetical protein